MKKLFVFILSVICFTSCKYVPTSEKIPSDYSIGAVELRGDTMSVMVLYKNDKGYPIHRWLELTKKDTVRLGGHDYDIYHNVENGFSMASHSTTCICKGE